MIYDQRLLKIIKPQVSGDQIKYPNGTLTLENWLKTYDFTINTTVDGLVKEWNEFREKETWKVLEQAAGDLEWIDETDDPNFFD